MHKTLNILVYLPGWGGNFLRFLLSTQDNTFPILPENMSIFDQVNRLEYYSFKNIFWKYGSWVKFHKQFAHSNNLSLNAFVNQDKYSMMTVIMHPGYYENYPEFLDSFLELECENLKKIDKINYLLVGIQKESKTIVDGFRKENGGILHSVEPDLENYINFKNKYQPYVIDFYNILKGQEHFKKEYIDLMSHVNLIQDTDSACLLYKDWYKSRKMYRYNNV